MIGSTISNMILSKTILICEDNLRVLSKLLEKLDELEGDQPYDLNLLVLTNYEQIDIYINGNPKAQFDIIILDRDCKLGGSFHNINLERFGAEKVISISTVEEYNEAARKRGVKKIVLKDIRNLDKFASAVINNVKEMISTTRFNKQRP